MGHEVTVLVSHGYRAATGDGYEALRIVPFTSAWGFGAFLKLFRLCRDEKFDCVDLQYSPPLYGVFFKLLYPLIGLVSPAVVTLHTLVGGGLINRFLAMSLVLFTAEVISTNEEVSYLIRRHLTWKKNLVEIPIGSNIIPPEHGRPPGIKKKEGIVLTHFGLFYPGKGVETILEAAAGLKKEYDDFRLFMLGGKWPGAEDYYDRLRQRARELGLADKVSWLGYLADEKVSEYLSMTDIFLVPFDAGISIRRGSYMAGLVHGLPIVSTRTDIGSEYIKDGENIVLVPPRDAAALKEKILELIKDPGKRARLGENARRLAAEFSWPKIALEMVRTFEKIKC